MRMHMLLHCFFIPPFVVACGPVSVANEQADTAALAGIGDLDGDGAVRLLDVAILQRQLAGADFLDPSGYLPAADADRDGRISRVDATALLRAAAGASVLPVLFGDANLDGRVTARDVSVVTATLAGGPPLPAAGGFQADVDQDGSVTARDRILIQEALAGTRQLPVVTECDAEELVLTNVGEIFVAARLGDAARLTRLLTGDAVVNESDRSLLLEGLAPSPFDFSRVRHRFFAPEAGRCMVRSNYTVDGGAAEAVLDIAQVAPNTWRTRSLSRSIASSNDRDAIVLMRPTRNLFLGERNAMTVIAPRDVSGMRWSAQLRLADRAVASTYTMSVAVAPRELAAGRSAQLVIQPRACRARDACPEYDHIMLDPAPTGQLTITATSGSRVYEWNLSPRVFNGKDKGSVYTTVVTPEEALGPTETLSDIAVRVRLRRLSHTYFAVQKFDGGYMGVSYRPEADMLWAQRLSIWNDKDYDERNQFINVNTADGFDTHYEPPSNKPDNNYLRIANQTLGWEMDDDYTFRLHVELRDHADGLTWTHYTGYMTQHAVGGDVEWRFGTIARPGPVPLLGANAFIEAVGASLNERRQEILYKDVRVRKTGSPRWTTFAFEQDDADVEGSTHYPAAAWMTSQGLIVSTSGDTPLVPGRELLDY